jgi:adenylosuccinate synthase
MQAIAVIGANFGDEGKGRLTDHFAAQAPAVVVRHNGGAQAGHTVVTPEGHRHVFSHFGSGTLAGRPTFLSHFFIVNPFLFVREARLFPGIPEVYLDPSAPLTTPWDMLINREVERARGHGRHGSCGYGIGETIARLMDGHFKTTAADMADPSRLANKLQRIHAEWVPKRLAALGVSTPSDWFTKGADPALVDQYLADCAVMHRACVPMLAFELSQRWDRVIFEGAQGLCLDEEHHFFPHVTRSRTGIANVGTLCRIADIDEVEAVYVTRAYLTRHGAGPLPTEDPGLSHPDATNVPNEWQGSIRFGHLDLDLLAESVNADVPKADTTGVRVSLAITCLDQVGDDVVVKQGGRPMSVKTGDLPVIAMQATGASKVYTSSSPGRRQ